MKGVKPNTKSNEDDSHKYMLVEKTERLHQNKILNIE